VKRKKRFLSLVICLIVLIAFLGTGCGDNGSDSDNGNGPVLDCDQADSLVIFANDSLGRQLTEVIEVTLENADSSFRPSEIDFSGVNGLYQQAASLCPTNLDAQFGVAFTGLLLFVTDPDLSALFDDFKHLADTLTFFPISPKMIPQINMGGPMGHNGIPVKTGELANLLPALTKLDHAIISTAAVSPNMSDIQNLLETKLLPKIINARNGMLTILDDANYTFTITHEMQGNSGASPVVLDQSDFRAFLAGIYAAEAVLHIFFSRNLDLTAYTPAGLETAVNQSGAFLDLKGGGVGANHMSTAKSRILSAATTVTQTIDHLIAEINTDQTNDLIKVFPGDESELLDIKDSLIYYSTYFLGPKDLEIIFHDGYWYYDGMYWIWIEENDTLTLMVDISQFFDNPLGNPKDFVPGYSITIQGLNDQYIDFASQHFSRADYWDSLSSLYGITQPNDTPYFSVHLPDLNTEEFYQLLGDWSHWQQFHFGWDDIDSWCAPGDTHQYCYSSYNHYLYMGFWEEPDALYVCSEWTANSFAEWTWPDPTFNGLLPNMTSAELKEHILGDGTDWEKSGCNTFILDFD
jgi:hypothetical protein